MRPFRFFSLLIVLTLSSGWTTSDVYSAEPVDQVRFFETEIRPVLVQRCQKCHGERRQRGQLRLDTREAALAGGESGPAIVPGRPDESMLIDAIRHESFEMPPDDRLPDRQIAAFTRWVEQGAIWPADSPTHPARTGADFSAEERSYWAFQPVTRPEPPVDAADGWSRNEIDRFIHHRLVEHGLTPAPAAEPRTLLRRICFDLTGLPPTPEQAQRFLADPSEAAYEQLVDELLASPRYGEHWARHWLDVVRYSESDGFRADAYRPDAWRYRDYVIGAFNQDKPYNEFVIEQLAGDEYAPERADALVATGFLRLYLYEYNQRDARTQWQDILNELTDVTGDVFLGMGMGCARCHDHKFDPILQKDYFRLQAFLQPILPRDDVPAASREQREQYALELANWQAQTQAIREQIDALRAPYLAKAAHSAISKFPEDIQEFMAKEPGERTPLEQQIADLVNRQVQFEEERIKYKDEDAARLNELESELEQFKDLKPQPLPMAITISDVGPQPPRTVIPDSGEAVEPGFLSLLDPAPARISPPTVPSTGRRLALARWIADPANPLSTRVIVNRVWQKHFGRGIVATPSDFGHLGELPSHPELLDWLTSEFVEQGWSLKKLHRRIVLSSTYRQSAYHPHAERYLQIDPQNQWRWKNSIRRLHAEQIRDALLMSSGELDLSQGGPSVPAAGKRRSIYSKIVRNSPDPLLHAFDAADGFNSTAQRSVTTTATQALLMLNGEWALERTLALARAALSAGAASDSTAVIHQVYQRCLSRKANPDELELAAAFIREQIRSAPSGSTSAPIPAEVLAEPYGPAIRVSEDAGTGQILRQSTDAFPTADFTVEAIIKLDSLYADATVRTICSQWDSNNQHKGWSLGVTSTRSAYQPRNLILQIVGDQGYEVTASNLRPELGKPYYVSAAVSIAETGEGGIVFWMKDLSTADAPLQSARVAHKNTGSYQGGSPLVIGGRTTQSSHRWNGLLDEIRITAVKLDESQLLIHDPSGTPTAEIIGHWSFGRSDQTTANSDGDAILKDSGSRHLDLVFQTGRSKFEGPSPQFSAVADLAHVLMLSNEFLYLD